MKLRINLFTALALSAASTISVASTNFKLDTGFNHATGGYFAVGTTDPYWQVISKYPLLPPLPVSPANVVPSTGWLPPPGLAHWISGFTNGTSPSVTGPYDPGYTVYRKCFCVMPEALVQNATQGSGLSLNANLRADDNVQVWLNNQLTGQLLTPIGQTGKWSWGTAIPVNAATARFRPYVNCVYVMVEDDQGGRTGFSMTGSVISNFGLWDQAGSIDPNSYRPCPCKAPSATAAQLGAPGARVMDTEQQDLQEVVKYAEERRLARQKAGKPAAPKDAPPRSMGAPNLLVPR